MSKSITIVCPVYNEEKNVEIFHNTFSAIVEDIEGYEFNFLFLDNRSTDNTFEILTQIADADSRVTILKYSKNNGVMKSIYTGILHCESDCCVVFDSDLQDPPELLHRFIAEWENGNKIVYGKRIKRIEPKYLTMSRNIFKFFQKKFANSVDIESGAWLIDQRVITELKTKNIYQPYLPGLLSDIGFAIKGVPYERRTRKYGESKFNFKKYLSYATDGLVSNGVMPLRLSIFIGCFVSIIASLLGIYFILAKFYWGFSFASGVAADITINLFFWGVHFILLGILGEYIGRIYLKDQENKKAIVDVVYTKKNKEH